jgi:hypothetical protein
MRTLGTRRAVLVAGAAAVATVALAGCSAGQVAETSLKRPSNMGVNSNNVDNSVLVRNLAVVYNGTAGYPVDKPAPLQLSLINQTTDEVRVTVSTSRPTDGTNVPGVITGTSIGLVGPADSAAPTPSATPSAAANAASPAVVTLAPMGSATFLPGGKQSLQVSGLSAQLTPGQSVYVTFTFSNGVAPLTLPAPVGIPLTAASRAPGISGENSEE